MDGVYTSNITLLPWQVRVAIENATRAEEYARRWLAILTRDCNRFCKIMNKTKRNSQWIGTRKWRGSRKRSLTEDNPAASERVIKKERKVSFADEAGGMPKYFKNDRHSPSN
ncbi:hypothetical protein GOBAR_AA26693 [Gossypium barbadense]|uniref:Uncharacterized protein n=1 Tax=Gossypium barbadense TaxID=3634 RepID=A0A2P5WSA4_GOSBA|nr:hypothetical protein GOBAR_AA26693 [Gossypium barbadense]